MDGVNFVHSFEPWFFWHQRRRRMPCISVLIRFQYIFLPQPEKAPMNICHFFFNEVGALIGEPAGVIPLDCSCSLVSQLQEWELRCE